MVLNILGILVALPGAVWATVQVVDRFRQGPDDDQDDDPDEPEE